MAQVKFTYKGQKIVVQCSNNDMMSEIFKKFSIKANVNLNSVYFIYNGNNNINQYLTFLSISKDG